MKHLFSIIFTLMLDGCVDFSLSQEEMTNAFEGQQYQPISVIDTIGENHVHYVHILNGRKNLAVFIHGSPGSWSAFIDFMKNDTLLTHFDMLSIDRPGYGLTDPGKPQPVLEQQAYLVQKVLGKFAHQNKVLVGHSLGGPVVARVAMDYPDLVQGMVLVAPSIDPSLEKYEWYRTWIDSRVGGWFTPQDFWVSNEEIMPLKRELQQMSPLWIEVQASTIVIHGTEDMLVPNENAEFATRMLSDSLLEVRYLQGVNHFIPWSNPDEIVQALMDLKPD